MAPRPIISILGRSAGLLLRRPALTVALTAAAVRLVALFHIPLIVTNDGVGYAQWAISILYGDFPDLPIYRTPGYPLFLAALFAISGIGPVQVLMAHHLLGVATSVLVCLAARRFAGPSIALACGLAAALDPRLLTFECYLLTETLAVFLFVASIWLALAFGRPVLRAAALGGVLAALCLVRPAFQIAAPLLAAAALLPLLRDRRLFPASAALVVVFGILLAPWLIHNHGRGIAGLSGANSVFRWLGARQAGLIDGRVPPPERLGEPFDRLLAGEPSRSDKVYPFLARSGAWSDPAVRAMLDEWTNAAIRSDPAAYAGAIGTALLWQLDIYPSWGTFRGGELRWYMRRLAGPPRPREDAPNFQFNTPAPGPHAFAMHREPGALARFIGATGAISGAVNVVLFAAALAAGVLSLARRRWAVALVLASGGAYYAAHALMLLPYSRFSLPVWATWCIVPAMLAALLHRPDAAPNRSAAEQKNSSRPLGREP